jgi:hypothetical protein
MFDICEMLDIFLIKIKCVMIKITFFIFRVLFMYENYKCIEYEIIFYMIFMFFFSIKIKLIKQ